MKKIEITTPQNVTIEYKLAGLSDRIIAFIIDLLLMWGVIIMLGGLLSLLFQNAETMFSVAAIPIFFFYTPIWEIYNAGKTPGKHFIRLQVVKMSGVSLNAYDIFMRWAFRMVDIYFSLGSIASVLISSSSNNQRLGDILAGTAIIKTGKSDRLSLEKIMKIHDLCNYEVQFPAVTTFTNDEMLLIKETSDRLKKHRNDGHKKAATLIIDKICKQLQINTPKNQTLFLDTLVKDYVVLTR